MNAKRSKSMVIAGDVCLDVVGVPIPPPATRSDAVDNWRQTGETQTHYLPGGVMLLEEMIRASTTGWTIDGAVPQLPEALAGLANTTAGARGSIQAFMDNAERLNRREIVHSLLLLGEFPSVPGEKRERRLRLDEHQGYSGPPDSKDPSIEIRPPRASSPQLMVLDDTGNLFRRHRAHWPAALNGKPDEERAVIYKLHHPFPQTCEDNAVKGDLWCEVKKKYSKQRLVIVSIDDIRADDVAISRGLSWERTALDVVWQLQHSTNLAELRDCPHLIIRMGSDGAIYWQGGCYHKDQKHKAWIIYDPLGIEGTGASEYAGKMVGYGCAFTAGFVGDFVKLCARKRRNAAKTLVAKDRDGTPSIIRCITAGLKATRRLLAYGFGAATETPRYPIEELFSTPTPEMIESSKIFTVEDPDYACGEIPIIPQADIPDRGYWRLLDSIFEDEPSLLRKAAEQIATDSKPDKDDKVGKAAAELLKRVPLAVFAKALRAYDRHEIENYRALYTLMLDYISTSNPARPLSVAVFGPPGAGKSFGVKMVAKSLGQLDGRRPISTLTFNLSQYQSPDQLASAFHLVRDLALNGKIPLVFFDEFDSKLDGVEKGWLRYMLAPMQDGEFVDDGTPHPIGQAIFVFAGGTASSYAEFAQPFLNPIDAEDAKSFKAVKGPDFLSRLRGTLDIPGLDLDAEFDAYGPIESFPCEGAILLRRAGILQHQLSSKASTLKDSSGTLQVTTAVLRTLLHIPRFVHGNRSFEALLDMSRLSDATKFHPSLLPSASHVNLHANATHLGQLIGTHYPFTREEREAIARSIQESFRESVKGQPYKDSHEPWETLPEKYKRSNLEQADHLAVKLRAAGLWFRKRIVGSSEFQSRAILDENEEALAKLEHDRWVAEKRRRGWIAAVGIDSDYRDDDLLLHNCMFPWEELTEDIKNKHRATVREIPKHLEAAGLEVYMP